MTSARRSPAFVTCYGAGERVPIEAIGLRLRSLPCSVLRAAPEPAARDAWAIVGVAPRWASRFRAAIQAQSAIAEAAPDFAGIEK